jgi:RNA-directed DNA polymerase
MMDLVCEKVADGRVLSLIESFLKSGIMNEGLFEGVVAALLHPGAI